MSQQLINLGGQSNDGTGDSIRTAFDKVNTNFTEVYNDLTLFNSFFSANNSGTISTATINEILSEYANFTATMVLFQQDLNDVANLINAKVTSITAGTDTQLTRISNNVQIWNNSTLQSVSSRGATTTNPISFTNSTASTGTQSGALIVGGGVGIGGAINAGGNITVSTNVNSVGRLLINNLNTGTSAYSSVIAATSGTTSLGLFSYPVGNLANSGSVLYSNNPNGLTIAENNGQNIKFVLYDAYDTNPRVTLSSTGSILTINLETPPTGSYGSGITGMDSYNRGSGATITYTGGETKFGNWRQYHNAEEWTWALVYNTAVNPHTVFPATFSPRDTTNSAADIVFANRIDVAEGHSGQNFWGLEWAPANDTVPATQPDWAAGSAMRYYDGGLLALSNSWGNSAQWSSSGDPKYQPSGTFRDSAIQLISGDTVAGPRNNGYSHVMRTSATDGSFKIQDVTAFKNSSTYWIPITPPAQVGIYDRMIIDTSGNVSFPYGTLTAKNVTMTGTVVVQSGNSVELFNQSGGYYSYINGGTSTNASIVFGNSQVANTVMSLDYQGNLNVNGNVHVGGQITGLAGSATNNGYQTLPGGIIMQWGSVVSGAEPGTVTFPTPFPNNCFMVVATNNVDSNSITTAVYNWNKTGFTYDKTVSLTWMAIGN